VSDRAAPLVTVSRGAAPVIVPEVLDGGPGPDQDLGQPRRRRWTAVLVGVGLLVALGAADEVGDRAREQREREAVELLLLDDWTGSSSYESETGRLRYRVDLTVRNDGPRTVQLMHIGLPGVRLEAPVELDAGRGRLLSLEGTYVCGVREPAPVTVPLAVRTDAGQRYVDVPIPSGLFDTDPLADACDRAEGVAAGEPTAGS
jgi:hypothetical protein